MNSYNQGRLSPGGHSPAGSTDAGDDSPYGTVLALHPASPHGSISGDARALVTTRKPNENGSLGKLNTTSKGHGAFMCDCCPKKPKKFDTQEDLK